MNTIISEFVKFVGEDFNSLQEIADVYGYYEMEKMAWDFCVENGLQCMVFSVLVDSF